MDQEPPNLVLEMLREIRGDQKTMKNDIRAIREIQATHGRLLGELVQSRLRVEADGLDLLTRVERIEQRLGLIDTPTNQ